MELDNHQLKKLLTNATSVSGPANGPYLLVFMTLESHWVERYLDQELAALTLRLARREQGGRPPYRSVEMMVVAGPTDEEIEARRLACDKYQAKRKTRLKFKVRPVVADKWLEATSLRTRGLDGMIESIGYQPS